MSLLPNQEPQSVAESDLTAFLATRRGLEREWITELVQSRRLAWRVATAAGVLALAAVSAVAVLMPLKSPPLAHVIRVDNTTGNIEHVSKLGESLDTYGERIDRFLAHRYIVTCEGYDWFQIQEMYNTCGLLSSPDVQRKYRQKFAGDNALDKKLANQYRIAVEAQPPILGANNTATIRFTTRQDAVGRDLPGKPQHWIATLSFAYVNAELTPEAALKNPLGFQVLSYRVDPEVR